MSYAKNKVFYLILLLFYAQLAIVPAAIAAVAGSFDSTFSTDGKVATDLGGVAQQASAVALQADGKILVVGRTYNGADDTCLVARYDKYGVLDPAFDSDGVATFSYLNASCEAYAVSMTHDNKIIVGGVTSTFSDRAFITAKFNSDGSLDASFDGDGLVISNFVNTDDYVRSILEQTDGKILAVGYSHNQIANTNVISVVRYLESGELDGSFDVDGKKNISVGSGETLAFSAALQPDGKIVLAGYTNNDVNVENWTLVVRLNSDGSLDTSFGGDGVVKLQIVGKRYQAANAVALQSDGKIVLAGYYSDAGSYSVLLRLTPTGALDTTFNDTGKLLIDFGSGASVAEAVAIQPNGKIVIAGGSVSSVREMSIARVNTFGRLDTSFDVDGHRTFTVGSADNVGRDLALQSDGKIILVGYSNEGSGDDLALARLEGGPGVLNVSDTRLDFEDTEVNSASSELSIVVKNIGSASLHISSQGINDDFTFTTSCYDLVIMGSCTISVKFEPLSKGPHSGTLTLNSDGGNVAIPLRANALPLDTDDDGVPDETDAFPNNPEETLDTDNDAIGNNADTDDDGDNVSDGSDAFPLDAAEFSDSDNDGIGNNQDQDDDNDNVTDSADAFPLNSSESLDSDLDGTGNNADADDDNDNVTDSADAFPLNSSESLDSDRDGTGNNADADDDNDGVSDAQDAFPLDSTKSSNASGGDDGGGGGGSLTVAMIVLGLLLNKVRRQQAKQR